MNDEFEKKETEGAADEKKHSDNHTRKPRRSAGAPVGMITIIISLVAFVILYTIVNISSISSVASSIMSVITPVALGAGIAYLLNPILKFFEKRVLKKIKNRKILRVLGLTLTYVSVLLFLGGAAFLVVPSLIESIAELINDFDGYIEHTIDLINGLIAKYLDTHEEISINREQLFGFISRLFNTSGDLFQSIGDYVIKYGTGLVVGAKNLLFALFISVYVLLSKENLKAQAVKLATAFLRSDTRHKLFRYVKLCDKTFGGFFMGKIIDSLIIGAITFVTLFLFDMPFYLLVSAIVCVTNIIPVFGPFIGAIPSFFLIFIKDPAKAFAFLVIIFIIQQIDGNIIGPKILGNSTGMSALGVMVAIIIMGEWLGVVGMILGVPIFAVILTIVNEMAENRLRRKNLPINTAEYHSSSNETEPYIPNETISHAVFTVTGHLFGKLFRAIFNRKAEAPSEDEVENKEKEDNQKEE